MSSFCSDKEADVHGPFQWVQGVHRVCPTSEREMLWQRVQTCEPFDFLCTRLCVSPLHSVFSQHVFSFHLASVVCLVLSHPLHVFFIYPVSICQFAFDLTCVFLKIKYSYISYAQNSTSLYAWPVGKSI